MNRASVVHNARMTFQPRALLELLKPVTWFPPMWAFLCGAVSSGVAITENWLLVVGGICLAGPLVCGASQVVNDWFDRHVDAINEPERPIPSGRVPGEIGWYFALLWTLLSMLLGFALGPWVAVATLVGLLLAWAYSAPPLRLKQNGWWGNAAVGLSYEGLAWITGASALLGGALPTTPILLVALLYSIGAHGIMTLNDFKALKGDRLEGIRSLPVQLGPEKAARLACWVMAIPQLGVVALLWHWVGGLYPLSVLLVIAIQLVAMRKLLTDPAGLAPWYNGTGVTLYVSGMMISAFALRNAGAVL